MTNFDYLKSESKFESFAEVAVAAEKTSIICRLYQANHKSKLTVQRSFEKLESMKKALLQKYFG